VLFTGSFRRALDDKQRLPLPRQFREAGADPDLQRLYVTAGLDGCLAVYPELVFAALAERMAAGSSAAREVRDYSRLFYSQAASIVPDRQWRLRLPAELAKWAELSGEVMIVGVRDHIEIWAVEKWEQYVARCEPNYDQLAEMALEGAVGAATKPATDAAGTPSLPMAAPAQPR
jgi:MraZ protein